MALDDLKSVQGTLLARCLGMSLAIDSEPQCMLAGARVAHQRDAGAILQRGAVKIDVGQSRVVGGQPGN